MRLVPTLLVVFLLAGTAAAFAVTQGLKNERSPIFAVRFDDVAGRREPAALAFRLREGERITATVVGEDGAPVRTLVADEMRRAGRVLLPWDTRTDRGALAPDGVYALRVRLEERRQTVAVPSEIRVDNTAPRVLAFDAAPRVFSPDADGRADAVVVRYEVDEAARPLLYAGHRRVRRGQLRDRTAASFRWLGEARGGRLRPGRYVLTLRAEDEAGNVSAASRAVPVRLRYVEVRRDTLRARRGARFRIPVSTDARTVGWRLAGRTGVGPSVRLRARAPSVPGRYRLYVWANGFADAAVVVVRAAG